jgi:hypothetical protein
MVSQSASKHFCNAVGRSHNSSKPSNLSCIIGGSAQNSHWVVVAVGRQTPLRDWGPWESQGHLIVRHRPGRRVGSPVVGVLEKACGLGVFEDPFGSRWARLVSLQRFGISCWKCISKYETLMLERDQPWHVHVWNAIMCSRCWVRVRSTYLTGCSWTWRLCCCAFKQDAAADVRTSNGCWSYTGYSFLGRVPQGCRGVRLLLVDDPVSDSGAPVAASVFTNHNTGRCDSDDGEQRVQ